MGDMQAWLTQNGILLCNRNPDIPALEDIGCTWGDAMELIDAHLAFYSKAYKKRTAYLSPEAYYLIKALRPQRPMSGPARELYGVIGENPGADAAFLKSACAMESKDFRAGMDFLLLNLYVTAIASGRKLSENWSELLYCTAGEWERQAPATAPADNARERLWELVGGVMTDRQFKSLIR
ncbi:AlkZ-related protein [Acutalibacter sp. 1XD8-36]|uniref:AlkZ-related protein n=1 Tax=Acutalibacter sp. 1XD8-36 TaxID=2320852 RepID=UPI0026106666|nr:hypothetical protein [Acutalibacter sp. 1XD8-36]